MIKFNFTRSIRDTRIQTKRPIFNRWLSLTALFCLFTLAGYAQTAVWNLTTTNTPTVCGGFTAVAPSAGTSVTNVTSVNTTSGYSGTGFATGSGTGQYSNTATRYFQFSVTNTTASAVSVNSLNFTSYYNGPAFLYYAIRYSTNAFSTSTLLTNDNEVDAGAFNFSPAINASIPAGGTMTFRVYGYFSDGTTYRFGIKNFQVSSAPVNPTAVSATASSTTQIDLSATANTSLNNVLLVFNTTNTFGTPVAGTAYSTGNTITGGGTVLYNGAAGAPFYSHTGLTPGTTYYYKVFSVNGSCNIYSTGVATNATTPLPTCSGTPNAGTITSSVSSVCGSTSFSLNATNTTAGSGISYQWEKSPAGAGTFTPIAGATTIPYTVASQSSASDYRLVTTCSFSTQSATSNIITVTQNPFSLCYCTSGLGGAASSSSIDNTTIAGTTLNNSTPGSAPTFYTAYPASGTTTATLFTGNTYTLTNVFGNGAAIASLWIDYDQSGTFDAGEWTQITTNGTNTSVNFTVPTTDLLGQTGLRIRSRATGNVNGATNACTNFGSGETEDYVITIAAPVPCSGTPATPVATGPTTACANALFTLSATNLPPNNFSGITYQWQSSPAGAGTFTDITGATSSVYNTSLTAATDYRLNVTCSNSSSTVTSNIVSVAQSLATNCYCTPSGISPTDYISGFSTTGGTTNISNTPTGYSTNGYQNYSATLGASGVQGASIGFNYGLSTVDGYGFAIFIDYNQNGSFADAGELAYSTSTYNFNLTGSGTFTIPLTATLGTTRMRIVADYDNGAPAGEYCLTGITGEFEDYAFTVSAAPLCVAPTAQATNLSLTSVTTNSVNGTFTAAAPAASGYIVLQTPGAATPNTVPVDGTTYTSGATLGNATVVGVGAGTTFSGTSLTPGTPYTYTVYSYNNTNCTGGPLYYTVTPLTGSITTPVVVTYTGTGVWSNAANWSSGQVPNSCTQLVEIAPASSVTLDGTYQAGSVTTTSSTSTVIVPAGNTLNICGSFTNNGTLNVSGGTTTIGTNGLFKNTLNNLTGAVTSVSGGVMNINGNMSVQAGSSFSQTGGAIVVDGNAGGVTANSVASGTAIVNFATPNLTLTGGTFTIVDPHPATTLTSILDYNATGNVEASPAHTFIYGNGVSTDPGGNTGARIRLFVSAAGHLNLGTVIVNGANGVNRDLYQGSGAAGINGNLTINNGGEYRLNSALYVNGNLVVNTGGTLTTQANVVYFAGYTGGVIGNASAAQTVTNNGTIQNSTTAVTANFAGLSFMNTAGVTFNSDISFSGALSVAGVAGVPSIINMVNNSKLIQITGGTQSGFSATSGWINGRYQKAAAVGAINNIYPIGDATTYSPVTVINATGGTVTTAGTITASVKPGEYLATTAGVPRINSSKINQDKDVNRYWTIEEGGGIAFSAAGIKVVPTWVAADVDPGATTASFIVGRYIPSTWIYPTVSNPLPTSIEALNNNNSGANTIAGDYIVGEPAAKPSITVALQGAMQPGGIMSNTLQNYFGGGVGILPTTSPYGAPTSTYADINNPAGAAGLVTDWIKVSVLDITSATPSTPLESRSLLLRPDGSVTDMRGLAPAFAIRTGNMRLAMMHRNHLAILSNDVVMNGAFTYDFTTSLSQASNIGDPAQMVLKNGKWCMWAGDIVNDYFIDGSDRTQLNSHLGQNDETYMVYDLNLDGFADGSDKTQLNVNLQTAPNSTLINY